MLFSSAPATLTSVPGGSPNDTTSAFLPLSGSLTQPNDDTTSNDSGPAANLVLQNFPRDTALTSISANLRPTQTLPLGPSTVVVTIQVYLTNDPSGVPTATPGASVVCLIAGTAAAGSAAFCRTNGLNIPVSADTVGWIKVTADVSPISPVAVSIPLDVSLSTAFS